MHSAKKRRAYDLTKLGQRAIKRRLANSVVQDREPRLLKSTASYERCAHYGWIPQTSTVKV